MPNVLITAFEPYDRWKENSSWLALVALTRDLPSRPKIVTRRYPVDFEAVKRQLQADLGANYDFALHLGQSPSLGRIHLEAVGINIGGHSSQLPDQFGELIADGPAAYRSDLPLAEWSRLLRGEGIPAQVSYHAGVFLCNALLYLSLHYAQTQRLKTRSCFIHLPLAPQQVLHDRHDHSTLTSEVCAQGLHLILRELDRLPSTV